MGEIKSVKVDNWGVFFLQKLQNFFNKTDYCDLTLQFQDNSQLKVHRLVLSACTDYFNVLEQTCEVVDDAIIMPSGLQADVVVPIVNFMYTGTLEFELKMYNRLLRTAKDMNMTVLLKLLEAHRRTMEMHPQKSSGLVIPKLRRRTATPAVAGNQSVNAGGNSSYQTNQAKRATVGTNVHTVNRNVSTSSTLARMQTSAPLPLKQIGSTTFTRIKVENEQQDRTSTASSGYSLIKHTSQHQSQPTSPFEQLRKGYNNNKRPAVSTFVSPPAKKPNLEDVKEFAEQQRMRKQIAAEYGDDDYDASNIMDDDTIHNDDDDDEMMTSGGQSQASQATSTSAGVQTIASSTSQQSEDPPGTTTIIVKQEGPDKPPTIVVKDNSNSKLNHAKIISEVIRQYPHLVKGNKNIKLKIMPNSGGQTQKIIVKKDTQEVEKQTQQIGSMLKMSDNKQQPVKSLASNILANRPKILQKQQTEISSSGKANSSAAQTEANKSSSNPPSASGQPQKRRIDSKTMHALIALGAENTTGPWLCLRCGRNGHPISIPSYRGFRRHLINTHKEAIDSALCEHCGWRSASKRELHFHMQLEHKVRTNLYIFPECQLCQQMCIDSDGLNQHLIDSHPDENKQQCIYCNKIFPVEIQLYTHMKTFHKKQALEDGIIDYSDDENQPQPLPPLSPIQYEHDIVPDQNETQQTKKIKILSDISLPVARSIVKTDSFVSQQELTTSVVSEEQDHDHNSTETKFVGADGTEVFLTAEQRKEILSQLNQEHEGSGIVMVLNSNQREQQLDQGAISHDETSQATTATNEEREEEGEEEQVPEEDDDDQNDDNQIYNEMKAIHSNLENDCNSQPDAPAEAANDEASLHEEDQEEQDEAEHDEGAEHLEESKESMDNLEWAENLISEHELADEVPNQTPKENSQIKKTVDKEEIKDEDNKSQDEISKKLKELTGDWSEDDEDDIPAEEPLSQNKDITKEKESSVEDDKEKDTNIESKAKDDKENQDIEDNADLLASLQNSDIEETDKHKKSEETVEESESIDEDDIDKALKSLHKEDVEDEYENIKETEIKPNYSESIEEKDGKDETEPVEEKSVNEEENSLKEKDAKEENSLPEETVNVSANDGEKSVEKLKKIEDNTINDPEAASSTVEVDEKTKKDLLDSLLTDQAETMENTAVETLNKEDNKTEIKRDDETNVDDIQSEEFLDATPEKKQNLDDNVEKTATEASSSTAAIKLEEASFSSAKEKSTLSSEEQVKSLISEWGDDDDEDEDNDTDLAKDL